MDDVAHPDAVDGIAPDTTAPGDATGSIRFARRRLALLVAGAAALVATVLAVVTWSDGTETVPPLEAIAVDAWAPYWAMDRSIDDLERHGQVLRDVSPFAYEAVGATELRLPSTVEPHFIASFVDRARAAGLSVTPSITDGLAPGEMAALLGSASRRAQHVAAIVELARELDADGIDIDYESFAFLDDRTTWSTTRVAFADFVDELGVALRADGRRLVVSIPPVYDADTTDASGYWVYDVERLAAAADQIRVMAYGYSGLSAGPVSPIAWVEQSIEGVVEAAGGTERIVLGVPLYGTNAVTRTSGDCPEDAPGTTAVTLRTIDDLIARRDAKPELDPVSDEWTFTYDFDVEHPDGSVACVQTRVVTYVDAAGARARIDLAREYRLAGVALWGLGYEDDVFWNLLEPVAG